MEQDCSIAIGIDEAGRGPLAGPVVAAAIHLEGELLAQVRDSKTLSPKRRETLFQAITDSNQEWAIASASAELIDEHNIRKATAIAMYAAAAHVQGDKLLIDGNMGIDDQRPQETIVKGDQKEPCISAASILAKVYRDRLMQQLGTTFPEYGLEKHSGYPTKQHKDAVADKGPSIIHRRTFRGVKEHLAKLRNAPTDFAVPSYLVVETPSEQITFTQETARRFW